MDTGFKFCAQIEMPTNLVEGEATLALADVDIVPT